MSQADIKEETTPKDPQYLYDELSDCLENLVKIYRHLLELVRKEKDILVQSRLEELNENNKAKDALVIRVRSLENARLKCARDLALAVGADHEQPRLLDIATRCKTEWAAKLQNLHSVLELLMKRVSEVNKQNEELVQAALRNITGAMEAIKGDLQPKATYARQGQLAEAKDEGGHLVSREA
jgi:flagellar biosynthesis/type III secretory pathway chaperone